MRALTLALACLCAGLAHAHSGWEFQPAHDRVTLPVVATAPKEVPVVGGGNGAEAPVPDRPPSALQPGDPAPELLGTCFSTQIEEYEYTLCPYANVTQKDTTVTWAPFWGLLGTYDRWEVAEAAEIGPAGEEAGPSKAFLHQLYTDGTPCGDMPRQTAVIWECGAETGISGVSEPTTCHYALTLTTPAACEDPRVRTWNTLPPAFTPVETSDVNTPPELTPSSTLADLKAARCAIAALASALAPDDTSQLVARAALALLAQQASDTLGDLGVSLDPSFSAQHSLQGQEMEGEVQDPIAGMADLKRRLEAAQSGARVDAVQFMRLAQRLKATIDGTAAAAAQSALVGSHPTLAALRQARTCESSGGSEGPLGGAAAALVEVLGALPGPVEASTS